ncbi:MULTISPECIES: Orn/Lys/Arg decarboxylase N-terminal domain-containing protein [Tardiphaga]|uniref:Amino acid decarboxylase n=1 Tax=Tardiphaga robiniae TaxID=943830 RepID=A0A161RMV4_9BRAD|nr:MULTISPECIES: Orn/Lys/Arg decarboxylase N-terminal domain-containing protein [Tardiphaga]KZD24538.1 amino acid decarboxylase [Tardiphaga robiniae]MDR6659590.1 arginine/lysine/ornithine decarboxylase [Tardiphaga robiniae]NUU41728.1 amino acid decarboxylase [Tardiphaga robiniae]QND70945.1 amino acid decarboxylase [Tardiphaga robiniae]UFS78222.1 amino acid decarboxylase [Tardiphaga sp. 37S4]
MDYFKRFNFLFAMPTFDADDLEGIRLNQIVDEIERSGFEVVKARKLEDATIAVQTDAAIGCMVVDWGKKGLEGKTAALINLMRKRGLDFPIILLIRRKRFEDVPVEVLDFIDGYVFLSEETPPFIAKNLISRLKQYAETLKTPFFGALVDYAEEGNQLWTCPGHNGGVFYSRSPIGRVFMEHLGEAVFRDDLDNSVLDLGDLLTHEGPALQAQKEAAQIFGAEKTYFVLNGTSTSNKVALSALVTDGDLVLFDRNNHKAALHGALMISGGVPIYVPTTRNPWGLIGPMNWDALDEDALRERIRINPLVTDPEAWKRPRPFRVAVVEQCTYDGTIYSAEMIIARIGHLCDYILFDEAWAGFMKFHPLYAGRFAMGLKELGPDSPGIIATQSTHKQLASFSQASQIHMKDRHIRGQKRRVEHRRFNESFMQHASTSPFYPLFASLDVGAQMMKGRSGEVLWDDTIRLGIELRKKMRAVRREFEEKETRAERRWFFEPFVPERVAIPDAASEGAVHNVPWESIGTDQLATNPAYWQLAPDAAWHGFPGMEAGFTMTDPNKLTVLTPGFDRTTGGYAEHGIPAPVVAQFLRENRIVPEKNDLNSLLFLLTPGVEASKAGTLISGLVAFKKLHDDNALLEDVIPEFARRRPARYAGIRLRDLCGDMHRFFREANVSELQTRQFSADHLPEIAMSPHDAARCLVRNDVDYLPIDEIFGRVATTPFVVYPPGIATIVPGERLTERSKPMIDYLRMFETCFNTFPGFDVEIQGIYRKVDANGRIRLYTYVVSE